MIVHAGRGKVRGTGRGECVVIPDLTRREFVESTCLAGGMLAAIGSDTAAVAQPVPAAGPIGPSDQSLTLRINGASHVLTVDPRTTLLDLLRERLDLTGTKKGCDMGACGACTVLVDGRRHNACLTLAVMVAGREITTIEGLAKGSELIPCNRPSSTTTPSSAATAPRARSCRPSASSRRAASAATPRSASS